MQRKRKGKSAPISAGSSPRPDRASYKYAAADQRITITTLSVDDFRLLVRSSSAAIACFELLHPFKSCTDLSHFVSHLYEQDSVCVEANATFLEMLEERDIQNILGASIAELLPESRDWPRLFSLWHQAALSASPIEAKLRKQDGDSWTASCAVYGIHDGPLLRRLWLVARDISAQASMTTTLKESELHYRSMLNTPQRISLRYDLSGLCEYVSPSTTSMLGLLQTDRFERPIYLQDLVHPDDLGALLSLESFLRSRTSAGPFTIRCRVRDGTFMPFSMRIHKVPSHDRTKVTCDLVGDRIDKDTFTTPAKAAVSEASACLLHDLNNLLTAAMAQATCETDSAITPRLETIRRTLQLCGKLTKEVAGYDDSHQETFTTISLQQALDHSVDMIRPLLGREIDLTINKAHSPAMLIACSLTDITQVVSNLVLNANEALGTKGKITISLESRRASQDAAIRAHLTISDNGPGIPPEILSRVFHHSVSSKTDATGHGLGLRSVKSIIDRIGGTIIVCSETCGTSVSITLPVVEDCATRDSIIVAQPSSPLSIVIADDEPFVRQMFTRVLSDLGHSITTASDGRSLLRTLEANANVDVVILDDHMPASRATDLAAQLHFQRPGLSIIVASGDPSLRQKMPPLPDTVSFLDKPFTRSEIIAALGAIHRKRSIQNL